MPVLNLNTKREFHCRNICEWLNSLQKEVDSLIIQQDGLFQGEFANEAALVASRPVGQMAWFAFVTDTDSFWYWSKVLGIWVNQNISMANYLLLSPSARACVPYLII